ncbi:hypothetical protein LINPERPRIM_LOCUS22366 [Linum perenne]
MPQQELKRQHLGVMGMIHQQHFQKRTPCLI